MKIELTAHEIGYIQGMLSITTEGREIAAKLQSQFDLKPTSPRADHDSDLAPCETLKKVEGRQK